MAGLSAVTLCVAIAAGKSIHAWRRTTLPMLEFVLLGTLLVAWMFEVWFVAKIFIAIGMGASPALVIAIALGIALLGLAGGAGAWLLLAAYSARGSRARFTPDLRNSLWFRIPAPGVQVTSDVSDRGKGGIRTRRTEGPAAG
jgi:hypothetical protein